MIRLLMGITLSEAGGSQRVVCDIIASLPEDRYDVTLVTSPGGELIDWINELNASRTNKVKIISIACLKRNLSPLNDAAAFLRLLALQVGGKYDIAHFHNSKMGILGRFSARIAGVPRVYYTVHGWGLNRKTTGRLFGALSLVEKSAARLSTGVVFVCGSDMQTGLRNGWAKSPAARLIYNGIEDRREQSIHLRETLGLPCDMPVIAFVARLAEPKDPMFAIRMCCRLAKQGVEHRLLIIGDGPFRADCMRLIAEQNAGNRVLMLGQCSDVRAILDEVDVFCLFTKWEGLPVSIIEAMFSGLPVVASGVGGVPELVRHGKTGYLLDGFDEDRAAGYVKGLLTDKELRLAMGRAARLAALEKFSLEGMAAGYKELYQEHGMKPELTGRAAWSAQYNREN